LLVVSTNSLRSASLSLVAAIVAAPAGGAVPGSAWVPEIPIRLV
jgi:hypothetical protein